MFFERNKDILRMQSSYVKEEREAEKERRENYARFLFASEISLAGIIPVYIDSYTSFRLLCK